jgi:hypothetical protein
MLGVDSIPSRWNIAKTVGQRTTRTRSRVSQLDGKARNDIFAAA